MPLYWLGMSCAATVVVLCLVKANRNAKKKEKKQLLSW